MSDNFKLKTAVSDPLTFASDESASGVHTPIDQAVQSVEIIDVTLSTDTNAYADGDLLADTQEIAAAMRIDAGSGILESITLSDTDDQGVALDLVILQVAGSLGTENAAADIADPSNILGIVEIAAADYFDLTSSQVVTKGNLNIAVQAGAGSTSLFVAAISRGTGTYTADGLKLKLGFIRN